MSTFIDWLTRIYGRALILYPPRFRSEYAYEMTRVFHGRVTRARARGGRLGVLACLLRALLDLAINAPLQRLTTVRQRRSRVTTQRHRRGSKGDRMSTRILCNLRYALRAMARRPGPAITIILTLAIGTAATISIFTIVDAALVRPLPYPGAARLTSLVQVSESFGTYGFSAPFLQDLRDRTESFDSVAGFTGSWSLTMTGVGEPRVVRVSYVSDGLLELLGARLEAGRFFDPQEHLQGGPAVALVGLRLWDQHFGAETPLEGQIVRLGGQPHTVVGIVAADVRMPIGGSVVSPESDSIELWLPFAANPFAELRVVPVMNVIGRLSENITLGQAAAELEGIRPELTREFPDAGLAPQFVALPLAELVTRRSRTTVLLLFAAAVLLLIIACANVANLMLTRAVQRSQEMLIRSSLGASKTRLMEQVLTESLLVATLGCGTGLVLAAWVLSAVPALGLQDLPPSAEIRIDARVAAFTTALAVATAVLFGLVPAFFSSRAAALGRLHNSARGALATSRKARNSLVVAEVALALILLVGAGLLTHSFWLITRVDPGFRAEGLISVPLTIEEAGYPTREERRIFLTEVLERLRGIPGVDAVAAVNRLPLGGSNVLVGVDVEGQATPDDAAPSDRRVVTPGYFATMGVALIEGRPFNARDAADSDVLATIVNRAAARQFWPDREPLGRRIRLMLRNGPGPWMTVVGVVGDIRHHGLDQAYKPEVYVPYAQASVETMVALLHGSSDVDALVPLIKERVWALNDNVPLDGIQSVDAVVGASVSAPRFRTLVINSFAGLALLLAGIGITGVISFSVAQRTHDIGIQIALGAQRAEILWATLREGLLLGILGAAIGLLGSLALSRMLESLLFEVTPTDPLTFAGVTAILLMIVAAASYLPARRATMVDPVEALRAE